jgi:hypothetical protein
MPQSTCGARRPSFEPRPEIGRNSIPCVLPAGHSDDHANAFHDRWETLTHAESLREAEWLHISRKLEALYGAVLAGDESVYTRRRIARLEALLAVLEGFPEALRGAK